MVQISDYPNYFVTKDGKVWSEKRKIWMIPILAKGYKCLSLSHNGIQKILKLHRLIGKAYIPNPNNYLTINHKDGNKVNNSIENLEWLSPSDNLKHAFRTGLNRVSVKCKENRIKAISKLVLNTQTGIYYDSATEAAMSESLNYKVLVNRLTGKRKNNTPFIYC